ncbi:hypothetical protein KC871_01140 [Candidatus Saccharibacteria bacterium]|nr:hypothetical protein [Candidatus Saccharibacteria bacterium]MCB9817266.1 hypothetical protein [Candidatus Nomurabacteria bacterium]
MQYHYSNHHTLGHSLYTLGAFLLLFAVTLFTPLNLQASYAIGADTIITLSNQARQQNGVRELSTNSQLMSAAQAKAEHMVQNQYFAHFAPDGKTPWDFFKEAGYSYKVAGENLAITNEDDAAVVKGWLNSPTHRENLLSTQYNELGIGIARYGDYQGSKNTTVVVALYGAALPQLSVGEPQPTNPAGTIAVLQPAMFGTKAYAVIGVAISLIIAGALLEIRHIRRRNI